MRATMVSAESDSDCAAAHNRHPATKYTPRPDLDPGCRWHGPDHPGQATYLVSDERQEVHAISPNGSTEPSDVPQVRPFCGIQSQRPYELLGQHVNADPATGRSVAR